MLYTVASSTPSAVTTLIDVLTALVTAVAGYVSTWISTIFASGNELLVVAVVAPMITIGISIIARLLAGAQRL